MATNSALTAVEYKIPNVIILVKKADYDAKLLDIERKVNYHDHDNYITTSEFNKVTTENFAARLTQGSLLTKTIIISNILIIN